eukprot:m.274253 g.274253  ORF g.274253 m.274253 type:complete len:113 (+) comp15686_c1_seq18:513-851(+)
MSLFTSVMASAHSPVESLWTSSVANTTDVKVSWHRPASTTASLMYTLLCRRADQEDALWVKECQEKDINSATITNLWPYTLYEVQSLKLVSHTRALSRPLSPLSQHNDGHQL